MTQQTGKLMDILNPVRNLTVEDFIQIAGLAYVGEKKTELDLKLRISYTALKLMQRWEELSKQPLKKWHFVCEVEKPAMFEDWRGLKSIEVGNEIYYKECNAYESALKEVLFEGFENYSATEVVNADRSLRIDMLPKEAFITFRGKNPFYDKHVTVLDFITEIDRYNRTASKPIELNWTPAIVDKLLK